VALTRSVRSAELPALGASSGCLMMVYATWKRIRRPPMGLAIRLAAWRAAMKQLSTTCDFANIEGRESRRVVTNSKESCKFTTRSSG